MDGVAEPVMLQSSVSKEEFTKLIAIGWQCSQYLDYKDYSEQGRRVSKRVSAGAAGGIASVPLGTVNECSAQAS